MSYPPFPDVCFPNTVAVRLCEDAGNVEGGFNPVPGPPTTFAASVQPRSPRRSTLGGQPVTVVDYVVYFQVDPATRLPRQIRDGDRIEWGAVTLAVLGPPANRGGWDWLWRVNCEYVST